MKPGPWLRAALCLSLLLSQSPAAKTAAPAAPVAVGEDPGAESAEGSPKTPVQAKPKADAGANDGQKKPGAKPSKGSKAGNEKTAPAERETDGEAPTPAPGGKAVTPGKGASGSGPKASGRGNFFEDLAGFYRDRNGKLYFGVDFIQDVADVMNMAGVPLVRGWIDGAQAQTIAPFYNAWTVNSPLQTAYQVQLTLDVAPGLTFRASNGFLPNRINPMYGLLVFNNVVTGNYDLTANLGDMYAAVIKFGFSHSTLGVPATNGRNVPAVSGDPGQWYVSDPAQNFDLDQVNWSISFTTSKPQAVSPRLTISYQDNMMSKSIYDPVTGTRRIDPTFFNQRSGYLSHLTRFDPNPGAINLLFYLKGTGNVTADLGCKFIPNNAFTLDLGSKYTPVTTGDSGGFLAETYMFATNFTDTVSSYAEGRLNVNSRCTVVARGTWDVYFNWINNQNQSVVSTPVALSTSTWNAFRNNVSGNTLFQTFKTSVGIEIR